MLPRRELTSTFKIGEWYYQSKVGPENSAQYQLEKAEEIKRLLDAARDSARDAQEDGKQKPFPSVVIDYG